MLDDATQRASVPGTARRYQPLMTVLAAACVGIGVDRWLALPVGLSIGVGLTAWTAWLLCWRRHSDRAAAGMLLLAVVCCAAGWHHLRWDRFGQDDLGWYADRHGGPACVEAIALSGSRRVPAPPFDPMRVIGSGDRCRMELRITGIRDGKLWQPASGRARLNVDGHLAAVRAGDRLRVVGFLSSPAPADNPGGFDFADYARADRQLSQLRANYPDCVSVVQQGNEWMPRRWIDWARSSGNRLLSRYLDDRRAGLAAAVLLGAREEMDFDRTEAYMETGTIHLLAISGLHIGIVAAGLLLALRLLAVPKRMAVVVVAVAVVFYAILTDARPPAVRASILVVVMCVTHFLGRRRIAFNALAAAGLIVLALNPADLFRTGTHLSFLAVAGLMWFGPRWLSRDKGNDPLANLIEHTRPLPIRWTRQAGRFFWKATLVSLIIWLLTMPLVMARFHLLTPIALLLNPLLWIPMAVGLAAGFGVLAFGWVLPPLATLSGWCCNLSLGILESAIGAASGVPGGHYWVPGPADWWLVVFYGSLGLAATFPTLRPPRRWCFALLAGWSAVGFVVPLVRDAPATLDCTFVSVGHGSAVVLELPSGGTVLYDAGQFSSPSYGARSIAGCLWSRGITHLDAVVLSHADLDHYNALPELLERFTVGAVYVSPVMFHEKNRTLEILEEAVLRANVPLREIYSGDFIAGGADCRIEVLHPPRRGVLGGDNANSLVLAVEYADHRVLLPGDLETPGLDDLMAEERWPCDVLLAPHHGSRGSNPEGLAEWCSPRYVVISGSSSVDSSDTTTAYGSRGARVLHTDDVGAVRATVSSTGLEVRGFLSHARRARVGP